MKTTLKYRGILTFFALVIFFLSCQSNDEAIDAIEEMQVIEVVETIEDDNCKTITYSKNVAPIINGTCLECHGNGKISPNLATFEAVKASAARVKNAIVSRRMPRGGVLTQNEIDAVVCWVDNGSLNN